MRKENVGLVIFGAILLLIGLGASFHKELVKVGRASYDIMTPYQSVGILLVGTGIVLISIGLFISLRSST